MLGRWASLLAVGLLAACGGKGTLPSGEGSGSLMRSTGQPYEVLVVADDTLARSMVAQALSAPMAGLPQVEPLFDVTTCDHRHFDTQARRTRNIVVVEPQAQDGDTATTVTAERNVYARPQIVVRLAIGAMPRTQAQLGRVVVALLAEERRRATYQLRQHRQEDREADVLRATGAHIDIPAGLVAAKQADGFIWLSDDKAEDMRNICVFRGANADSIVQRHIKGETDQMAMHLLEGSMQVDADGLVRGLWAMQGDAMGGPFVMRSVGGRTALAFVYAPGRKKRNIIRQLEAALHTLK